MATCFILDFDGGAAAQYDAIVEEMDLGGRLPEGGLFHNAGTTGSGWRAVDVWESPEHFERFAREAIMPMAVKHGLGEPKVTSFEVSMTRPGAAAAPQWLQVVRLPAVADAETFAQLDSAVLGPERNAPEGCIYHVNGPLDGGWVVVDSWASKELHDAFIADQVMPAMQAAGVTEPPQIEEMAVERALAGGTPAPA